jgi:hypothetical protein
MFETEQGPIRVSFDGEKKSEGQWYRDAILF